MDEIVENVKMAREYALLGNYDTSLVYFQGLLQQIQKYIAGIIDPVRKQKWHEVRKVIELFCKDNVLFFHKFIGGTDLECDFREVTSTNQIAREK